MSGTGIGRQSDEDLARRFQEDPTAQAGRAAASELFERYRETVYLWCFRRVRDHELALDLAQDVLISAYRALDGFQGRSRYASWLFTITRHRCYRAMRPREIRLDETIETDTLPSDGKPPDLRLEESADEDALLELIEKELEPEEQLAIWLRCVEKRPVEEITRRLHLQSVSGARGLLQKARRKLKAALEGKDGSDAS